MIAQPHIERTLDVVGQGTGLGTGAAAGRARIVITVHGGIDAVDELLGLVLGQRDVGTRAGGCGHSDGSAGQHNVFEEGKMFHVVRCSLF